MHTTYQSHAGYRRTSFHCNHQMVCITPYKRFPLVNSSGNHLLSVSETQIENDGKHLRLHMEVTFLDLGLSEGVLCNHLYQWSVRGPSVFKYLRDRSKDFSNFLHEVSAPQKLAISKIWAKKALKSAKIGVFPNFEGSKI